MAEPRNFRKGLLAHLILVPAWTASPLLLIGGLVASGAPHGAKGVVASIGLGAVLFGSNTVFQRVPILAVVFGMSYAAPSGRLVASLGAGLVAFLTWLTKGGKKDAARYPPLFEFLSRWSKDYYAQAELRGKLSDVKKEKSCFAFHPHGCLSAGFTINGCYNPVFRKTAGKVNWLCDHNLRYKNPTFRFMCDSVRQDDHAIEAADKKTFQKLMAKGENVSLIPGGFQDAVAYAYGKECTVLKKRKGFIKYCLQYGYRLHPVYTFGESQTFNAFTGLRKLRMKISEQNIPMVAFFGWPLLPFLPKPEAKILTYVGAALDLPKIAEPTAADVDKWHGEYMKALEKVFNDNRVEAGYSTSVLDIC